MRNLLSLLLLVGLLTACGPKEQPSQSGEHPPPAGSQEMTREDPPDATPADERGSEGSDFVQSPPSEAGTPSIDGAQAKEQYDGCRSNLNNIGVSVEYCSTFEDGGHYPESLDQLAKTGMKTIPTCPSAGRDTYSQSYRVHANPDAFTLFCAGENHPIAGADFPQYSTDQGVIDPTHYPFP